MKGVELPVVARKVSGFIVQGVQTLIFPEGVQELLGPTPGVDEGALLGEDDGPRGDGKRDEDQQDQLDHGPGMGDQTPDAALGKVCNGRH